VRDGIAVAALDASRRYNTALVAHLVNATVVMDHFHALALANRALDKVRRRVQNDTLGHRGRAADPLYRIRRIALIGAERPSKWTPLRGRVTLPLGSSLLDLEDPDFAQGFLATRASSPILGKPYTTSEGVGWFTLLNLPASRLKKQISPKAATSE
jgi:hypothetical protein